MVDIKWCLGNRSGLELVEPSDNMATSYLKMAEESLGIIENVRESKIWLGSSCYYTMYYSLYALMMKIGVKCGIHGCSLEFMKKFLGEFYSSEDIEIIDSAFRVRGDVQYYPDRLIRNELLEELRKGAGDFLVKSENVISRISEDEIEKIRKALEVELK